MATNEIVKYAVSIPNTIVKAAVAAPQKVQSGVKQLAQATGDIRKHVDHGVEQIVHQDAKFKQLAISAGKYAKAAKPARDPIGANAQTGWISQSTEKSRVWPNEDAAKGAFRTQSSAMLRPGGWNDNTAGLTAADAQTTGFAAEEVRRRLHNSCYGHAEAAPSMIWRWNRFAVFA